MAKNERNETNKIPENMTFDEAAEFWDKHSFLDYDDIKEVHFSVDWLERHSRPTTPEAEDQLLTEILSASKKEAAALEQLAKAQDCPALFRCAAVDQYVEILGPDAMQLLDDLIDFRKERNEEVRLVAFQNLSSLESSQIARVKSRGSVRTRGTVGTKTKGRPQVSERNWRQRAASDPSPRIRWLASLSHS